VPRPSEGKKKTSCLAKAQEPQRNPFCLLGVLGGLARDYSSRSPEIRYLRNCMKDWRAIAKAHGLDLSARELDRIAPPLEALEAAFRPLVRELTPGIEPSVAFSVEEDAFSVEEDAL
jgi:hypothetical protein